ncbi:MAG: CPBP family intramembrane metalloprotease [Bacteroidetes bacterium]|nr:CPBP family intramembrane metalloprotease [Bacteroidota bacterium]
MKFKQGSVSDRTSKSAPGVVLVPSYWRVTRSATYGFIAALPLLVLYEVMILAANRATGMPVRVGAEVWIKQLLSLVGQIGAFGLGLVVFAIGTGILIRERRNNLPIKPSFFARMIGESAVYALLTGLLVAGIVGRILMAAPTSPQQEPLSLFTQLALSIGAGLYEELLFRVALVGGLFWLFKQLNVPRQGAYVVAALVGAAVFSWVHYIGPLGDAFTVASFLFRFVFGLALNAIFLARGFGVAAWTHALYDVYVVLGLFRLL